MAKQVVQLQRILAKIQSTFGTLMTDLNSSDIIECTKPSISFDPVVTPVELVGAGFSQNQSVIGAFESAIALGFPLRTGGTTDSLGDWARFVQASGFLVSNLASGLATITPTSKQTEWKDLTLFGYSGNQGASSALLTKIANALFGFKITLDFEKSIATIDFTGKGVYTAAPAADTQPVITKSTVVTQSLKGATTTLFTSDYMPLQITLESANEISVLIDQSNTVHGKGISLLVNQKINWSAKAWRDGVTIPETILKEGTNGDISCELGIAPNKITIATGTSKAQITKIDYSETNGVETLDMSGPIVDNDISIIVDTRTPGE